MRVLRDVEGIGICELTNADVVRHVMVQRIVEPMSGTRPRKTAERGGSDGEAALSSRHRRRARRRQ